MMSEVGKLPQYADVPFCRHYLLMGPCCAGYASASVLKVDHVHSSFNGFKGVK